MQYQKNSKKVKLAPATPRAMDEINKEYSELVGKTGLLQFQVVVAQKNLEALNNRLLEVNAEANSRTALDQATKTDVV